MIGSTTAADRSCIAPTGCWWPRCTCEPAKACTDQAECDRAVRCRSENHCARATETGPLEDCHGAVADGVTEPQPAHSKSEYKRRVALGDPNVAPPLGVEGRKP